MITPYFKISCDEPGCERTIERLESNSSGAIQSHGWTIKPSLYRSFHYCPDHPRTTAEIGEAKRIKREKQW
jgi:hypothetical protein